MQLATASGKKLKKPAGAAASAQRRKKKAASGSASGAAAGSGTSVDDLLAASQVGVGKQAGILNAQVVSGATRAGLLGGLDAQIGRLRKRRALEAQLHVCTARGWTSLHWRKQELARHLDLNHHGCPTFSPLNCVRVWQGMVDEAAPKRQPKQKGKVPKRDFGMSLHCTAARALRNVPIWKSGVLSGFAAAVA